MPAEIVARVDRILDPVERTTATPVELPDPVEGELLMRPQVRTGPRTLTQAKDVVARPWTLDLRKQRSQRFARCLGILYTAHSTQMDTTPTITT